MTTRRSKIYPEIGQGFATGELYDILLEIADTGNLLITLANEIKADHNAAIAKVGAHRRADATNTVGAACTDFATGQTLVNDVKAKYNLHIAATASHFVADTTNAEAHDNSTDAGAANVEFYALINSMKAHYDAHLTNTGHVQSDTLNATTVATAATTEATAVALLNNIRLKYIEHCAQISSVLNADTVNPVTAADATTNITY